MWAYFDEVQKAPDLGNGLCPQNSDSESESEGESAKIQYFQSDLPDMLY